MDGHYIFLPPFLSIQILLKTQFAGYYHKVKYIFSPVSYFCTALLTDVLAVSWPRYYYTSLLALEVDCPSSNPNSAVIGCELEQIM